MFRHQYPETQQMPRLHSPIITALSFFQCSILTYAKNAATQATRKWYHPICRLKAHKSSPAHELVNLSQNACILNNHIESRRNDP